MRRGAHLHHREDGSLDRRRYRRLDLYRAGAVDGGARAADVGAVAVVLYGWRIGKERFLFAKVGRLQSEALGVHGLVVLRVSEVVGELAEGWTLGERPVQDLGVVGADPLGAVVSSSLPHVDGAGDQARYRRDETQAGRRSHATCTIRRFVAGWARRMVRRRWHLLLFVMIQRRARRSGGGDIVRHLRISACSGQPRASSSVWARRRVSVDVPPPNATESSLGTRRRTRMPHACRKAKGGGSPRTPLPTCFLCRCFPPPFLSRC